MSLESTDRRSFLGWLAGSAVALSASVRATPALARAHASFGVGHASPSPDGVDSTDEWLKPMKGKHKQIFDSPGHYDGKALHQTGNFLEAYTKYYGAKDDDVNAAIIFTGKGAGIVFNDAMWAKYKFGERFGVTDAGTKAPAIRNVFSHPQAGDPVDATNSVETLQKRGVALLLCNNTFGGLIESLAKQTNQEQPAVRTELLANRLPAITVVPAAVTAVNRAQEHGFTYYWAGRGV
jgi:intracellular sulfur oxidation DsrE/DsrF family protein